MYVPDTACVYMMESMCKLSLFTTAIHHRHPEPGMVDFHSGMVRMCAAGQMSATACEVPFKERVQTSARESGPLYILDSCQSNIYSSFLL